MTMTTMLLLLLLLLMMMMTSRLVTHWHNQYVIYVCWKKPCGSTSKIYTRVSRGIMFVLHTNARLLSGGDLWGNRPVSTHARWNLSLWNLTWVMSFEQLEERRQGAQNAGNLNWNWVPTRETAGGGATDMEDLENWMYGERLRSCAKTCVVWVNSKRRNMRL